MTDVAPAPRTQRADFRETSDPAVDGSLPLLGYRELYELWERQQWATQDLDFTQDRADWERMEPEERHARLYGMSGFFLGEQRVTLELGPMARAMPDEDMRVFLSTQMADEARHVVFFDSFFRETGAMRGDDLQARVEKSDAHQGQYFRELFDEMLRERVDRLAAEPGDLQALVESVTIYHMVIEGMLGLTGQHFILDYNEQRGTLPGFVEGFTNVARDEHRHVAFGARFLRDMVQREPRFADAIHRTLARVVPAAQGVLVPPSIPDDVEDRLVFGHSVGETRRFSELALSRRLKAIGLSV